MIGIVKEVFIPKTEDEVDPKKIGFKVLINEDIKEIITDCNIDSALIYKGNKVIVEGDNITFLDEEEYE